MTPAPPRHEAAAYLSTLDRYHQSKTSISASIAEQPQRHTMLASTTGKNTWPFDPPGRTGASAENSATGEMTDLTKRREKKYPEEELKQIMSL
ncbi:hypothetical protein DBR19_03350 [Aeromonas sp. HMWF014]|nr:hypothetical protein DBR19_03350 [Aeromonas sp. HMWF014]